MNEALIENWNSVVNPTDEVIYLGDFSLAFRPIETITPRLNGVKFLVPGNHDFCHSYHKRSRSAINQLKWISRYQDNGWTILPECTHTIETDEIDSIKIRFSHLPYLGDIPTEFDKYQDFRPVKGELFEDILVCGHVHEKWQTKGNMINVGVDVWDYKPVPLNTILSLNVSKDS